MNKIAKYILIFGLPLFSYILVSQKIGTISNYEESIFLGDQSSYFESSKSLYNEFNGNYNRCIGYPLLLGIPELFELKAPYGYWPIILNIIFLIITLYTATKIEKIINFNIAIPYAIIISFCFGYINSISLALTEIGFSMFIMMAIYNLLSYLKYNLNLFNFVLCMGMATLFRPGFYLFTFLTLIVGLITFFFTCKNRNILKYIYLSFIAIFITIGTQSIIMKKTFNTFRLTYIDDITWYRYLGASAQSIIDTKYYNQTNFRLEQYRRDSLLADKTKNNMSEISKADRRNILENNPKELFKAFKINLASNLLSGSFDTMNTSKVFKFTVFTNIVLSILPFIFFLLVLVKKFRNFLTKDELIILFFMLSIIAYTIATSAISSAQGDRFHIIFYPLSILTILICINKISKGLSSTTNTQV